MKNKVQLYARKANGEGSIFRRSRDGQWVGCVSLQNPTTGKSERKYLYGKNRTEVSKKLAELTGRIKSNSYDIVEKMTFGELMKEWLLVFKKPTVTARTFEGVIRTFKLHIESKIGNMKVTEIDTFVLQKLVNELIDKGYSNNFVKKNKHLIGQFFEYAIDNGWVTANPMNKVKVKTKDRRVYDDEEHYKALTPEMRDKFLAALNKDESNFLKPLCLVMMFGGLRIGEAIALKWKNINFENKTLKVERSITQVPKFDDDGNTLSRVTVVGDTKTLCSVREIPVTDVVVQTLMDWKEKQEEKNKHVKADLISSNSFIFANDDGSVRTYYGCRIIFDRWKRRNGFKCNEIHFHSLRHTFSNMLFEMNENPKVIQQLLGHRDVKTTIMVYNSVDSNYVRNSTDKMNEMIKDSTMPVKVNEEKLKVNAINKEVIDMSDESLDKVLEQLLIERKERERRRKEKDFEM